MHAPNRFLSFYAAPVILIAMLAGCRSATPPDDTSVNSAIQRKLAADTAISTEPVQSSVQSGVANLQGNVSSEAARALAASDASQVPGVRSVVNQLTVQAGSPPPGPAVRLDAPAPPGPFPPRTQKPSAIPAPRRNPVPPPAETSRNDAPYPPAPIERRSPIDNPSVTPGPQLERRPLAAPTPSSAAPSFRNLTIPAGTTLSVRITQTLDSATAQQGDTFSGSLANDVLIDGILALPAGTTVGGRLDQVHEAGHFKGSALLTLSLVSLNHRGERISIATDPYTQEGSGRGKNTAEKAGGGAAVGAILGGIFGGGKGAAIGAAAGGGLGAGANGVTRGQQVQIPSETLLRFKLASPVEVRVSTAPPTSGDTNLPRHSNL